MGANLRTRKHASTAVGDHQDLDARIVAVLAEHGPQDPLSLVRRVKGRPGDVAPRMCELVVARRVRVDGAGRFTLPEVEL